MKLCGIDRTAEHWKETPIHTHTASRGVSIELYTHPTPAFSSGGKGISPLLCNHSTTTAGCFGHPFLRGTCQTLLPDLKRAHVSAPSLPRAVQESSPLACIRSFFKSILFPGGELNSALPGGAFGMLILSWFLGNKKLPRNLGPSSSPALGFR